MGDSLITVFFLLAIISFLLAVIDIVRSNFQRKNISTVWLWIILFFPVIGPILYFQLKKKFFIVRARKFNPDFNRH